MNRRFTRLLIAVVCLAGFAALAFLQFGSTTMAGPAEDLKPFAHWSFGAEPTDAKVNDRVGSLPATVRGKPKFVAAPASAIEFSTPDQYLSVLPKVTPQDPFLPKSNQTILAWVRIDEPTEWGGILGCMQDNADKEAGIILGYNKSRFYFGLASRNTARKDGTGTISFLESKTTFELGRWYHVAATYDGAQMRLYVNGKPDGEKAQTGDVLYPASAPLVLGRYQDENEDYPMQGAIHEALWSAKAATPAEILAHFQAEAKLAQLPSSINTARFVIDPYLQFATRTGMTIMCETFTPTTCEVRYGLKVPMDQVAKVEQAATMHEVPLANLQPRSKYFYQVTCTDAEGKKIVGKQSTFGTAVDPTDAYSFAVIGDTQRNPIITGKVGKLMWERRPNFVLHMGDVVDNGADKKQWTDDLFKPCQELFSRVPVYPCIGNHEGNHPQYYKYFSLPKPEYYYSFTYGNAEFFILDTNKPVTPDTEQYKWIEKALAASTAKWKVCYHHHPLYSSDSDDYGNTWKGNSTFGGKQHKGLIPLYEKYNVDLAMNGHIHLYERTFPIRNGEVNLKTGITYVTSGGGGGGLEDFDPTPNFFKNQGRVDFHYCYYTIHGGNLQCHVYDHEGRMFDTFTIRKPE